ncbi:MAG TPA: hypothetical protein VES20_13135 [Bryobacteraceae bacterium]|nr:hypothetical protein [Bryobacteraceae bacterium]
MLHDRDTKLCDIFRSMLRAGGVEPLRLPARSPNLNAFAQRPVGEGSLRRALNEYVAHFHNERNHQGKGNVLLFPEPIGPGASAGGRVECRERLSGLLRYYSRAA